MGLPNGGPLLQLDGTPGWATARLRSERMIRCDAETFVTTLSEFDAVQQQWPNPIDALKWLGETAASEPAGRRWVGYISYDAGRLFERLADQRRERPAGDLFCFAQTSKDAAVARDEFSEPVNQTPVVARPRISRNDYLSMVRRALEYIRAGDVFQVNLSQQFAVPFSNNAWTLAERLRRDAPAAYGACLDFGDYAIVSNSPELFFEVGTDRTIRTRPIKGTRPRIAGMDRELLDSAKDAAELNMIVDLERNDLGRICEIGSVRVEQTRTIETHPTVFHGVATVAGRLRDDVTFVEILRAMFPGGSITGAPKIRAMEIIDELEPVRRGVYCGAIGWLGGGGAMQFNVAIRTIVLAGGVARFSVGGGVVADSDGDGEYEETLVKARAMLRGLGAGVG